VHRADGSGTTFLFTDYLSKTNTDFKTTVGAGTAVKWPVGVGGKGNEGVSANVEHIKGSIGYVEYAYAKKNKMEYTQLKNRDGQFVEPGEENFKSAAAGADWAKTPGFGVVLTDQAVQQFVAPNLRQMMADLNDSLPGVIGGCVDWYAVEMLGAKNYYPVEKSQQAAQHGVPPGVTEKLAAAQAKIAAAEKVAAAAAAKALAEKLATQFVVMPGLVVTKIKRQLAA